MDADLQHPPETIPKLAGAVRAGTDLVIGSRFTAGGSIRKFSTPRILISRGAATLARLMLPDIGDVNDILSGFFAFRRSVVTEADLNPIGYKFLLSVLVRGKYSSVKEIGFRFDTRNRGRSKLGARNILHFLTHLFRLSRY
jgi:dolichol-phosphate mannosyltransferase